MQNIQPDNLAKIKKLERQLIAGVIVLFILIIGFLAVYDLKPGQEALALSGTYTSRTGLTATDWEKLPIDFVTTEGGTMTGKLIINGQIGLNTATPDSNYEVVVKDSTGGSSIYVWGNGKNAELALGDGTSHWAIYSDETSSDDLRFWRGSNRMVITDDGKVGIGTDSPYTKLHVNDGNLYVTNNGNNPFILVGDSQAGGEFGLLKWDSVDDKLYLGTSAGGNTITINETGDVGIGVPNPKAKLDVNGRIFGKLGSGAGDWTTYTDQQWDSCGNNDACRDKQTKTCNDGEYVCGVRILNDHHSDHDEDTVQLGIKCCKMTQ